LLVVGSAGPGGLSTHAAQTFQAAAAVVFPVDEIDGIRRFADADHQPVPATVARASAFHTRAIVPLAGRQVGLLDAERLLQSLQRSLE
jgi:chemotaxis-related protein WspD